MCSCIVCSLLLFTMIFCFSFVFFYFCFFFFKQKTAYEMRISDWSSDVCSSDLRKMFGPSGLISDQRHVGRSARSGELLRGTRDPLASLRLCAKFSGSVGWALRARLKAPKWACASARRREDRKSTRLNSSH